ncbi:FadR/GntR family transcriptional regulator [Defluviimonas sp. SAOS-178_SWC]|uniref:FadR/GntR family transcriptional regulator n=1 Tax=Defluviimonas sp. SAOS-178_SWC TaxID=3121287 RepID=UPI003222045F
MDVLSQSKPNGGDQAISQLQEFIADGGFEPGFRLPPERELCERLGMTRNALRRALDALERDGVIWRHVGKGTFVSDTGAAAMADPMLELGRQITPFKMMRARLAIEPAIAREAAVNASGKALMAMQLAMERAHSASTWAVYETQDDLFHHAIAEATDNLLLIALFNQLNGVRRAVAWGSVVRDSQRPPSDHSSFAEHEAIAMEIAGRRPEGAYEAMRTHLKSVSERLFGGA